MNTQQILQDAAAKIAPHIIELVIAALVAGAAWFRAHTQTKAAAAAVESAEQRSRDRMAIGRSAIPGEAKKLSAVAQMTRMHPLTRPRFKRMEKLVDRAVKKRNAKHGKAWPS